MLPMLLRVKIHDENKSFKFCLPLGLVYLLLAPFLVLGAIAYMVLLVIPGTERQARSYLPLIKALPSLLSASIGTEVEVQSKEK
ncbi:MAG: hypothetical protein PHO09_11755, partial [Sphaerochaeta sp.]|nr:hypothetical protein [Sphaerochaeta sp.]